MRNWRMRATTNGEAIGCGGLYVPAARRAATLSFATVRCRHVELGLEADERPSFVLRAVGEIVEISCFASQPVEARDNERRVLPI
jgi:hypothetical protein